MTVATNLTNASSAAIAELVLLQSRLDSALATIANYGWHSAAPTLGGNIAVDPVTPPPSSYLGEQLRRGERKAPLYDGLDHSGGPGDFACHGSPAAHAAFDACVEKLKASAPTHYFDVLRAEQASYPRVYQTTAFSAPNDLSLEVVAFSPTRGIVTGVPGRPLGDCPPIGYVYEARFEDLPAWTFCPGVSPLFSVSRAVPRPGTGPDHWMDGT